MTTTKQAAREFDRAVRDAAFDTRAELQPQPVAEFDLQDVADIIRDMSGCWRPEEMLHDCDMHVEIGSDGRLRFLFFAKDARPAFQRAYAKAK